MGSTAVGATSASSPGGGLDAGLDGSTTSGKHVPIESQVGGGYLIDAVIVIGIQKSPDVSQSHSAVMGELEVAHVDVTVRSGSFRYSRAQFTFVARDGERFAALNDDVFPPVLGGGAATAGQTVTGNVVFKVPAGGGTVELHDADGPRLWGWTTKH